jgi:SAM-dependent methyltransferase
VWRRLADQRLHPGDIFPPLGEELGRWRPYLRGTVLNAGAGDRSLRPFVDGEVVNLDIEEGLHNSDIDVHGRLDAIPFPDGHFDVSFCNAVLEHVDDPVTVVRELARVCRPGGLVYLTVAFLQPEHRDPGDYYRFSRDGLRRLVEDAGCQALVAEGMHSVYHTLAWITDEWLGARRDVRARLAKAALFPYLRHKCRTSTRTVESVASAYRIVAVRLPGPANGHAGAAEAVL